MINIRQIIDQAEKSIICNNILKSLPNWFGIESSIADYREKVKEQQFYAAFENDKPIGFAALKIHNPYTAEVYVMGILEEFHKQGIGKELMNHCVEFSAEKEMEFLTVKTLDKSRESKSYEKTRLFYEAMGFKPLEVFPLLWGEANPCFF